MKAIKKTAKPFKFRPPRTNSTVIRIAKLFSHVFLNQMCGVSEVEVLGNGLDRLRAIMGKRAVLAPNHPSFEPVVMFHVSRLLQTEFNFLAAKEVFEEPPPVIRPWLLQRMGAYSIVRGTADRQSFRCTRNLLKEGKRFIVIFPEGTTSWHNETVLPFQEGAVQFAFWALDDLAREGDVPPLYFVPIAIKYCFTSDMRSDIVESLSRLERKLNVEVVEERSSLYERLRTVGEELLRANEKTYKVRLDKDANMDERIQFLKETIIKRVADALGVSVRGELPLRDRIRDLFNHLDRIVYVEPSGSEYDKKLHEEMQDKTKPLYEDLWRVDHLISVTDHYVSETLTPERFLDVLGRIEVEVFGSHRMWGPRRAYLRIGEPFNLANDYKSYKADKRATLSRVTLALEDTVCEMLGDLSRKYSSPPVE